MQLLRAGTVFARGKRMTTTSVHQAYEGRKRRLGEAQFGEHGHGEQVETLEPPHLGHRGVSWRMKQKKAQYLRFRVRIKGN